MGFLFNFILFVLFVILLCLCLLRVGRQKNNQHISISHEKIGKNKENMQMDNTITSCLSITIQRVKNKIPIVRLHEFSD